MKIITQTILLLALLAGCTGKAKQKTIVGLITYPLEQTTLITDFTPFIDSVQIIPLEAKEEAFITHINKILLTSKKQLIISNSTGILLFDADGSFRHTIGSIGRAPEEYQTVCDMCLSQNEEYLLVVDIDNQILQYSINDGHFIKKIQPELPSGYPPSDGIAPAPQDGFFLFGGNLNNKSASEKNAYSLNLFDKTGKHISKILQREDYMFPFAITQSYNNTYQLRPQVWDNICYRIQDSQVSPVIQINFKKEGIPHKYAINPQTAELDLQKLLFAPYYKLPMYFHETRGQLHYCCAGPKGAANIFFLQNKNTLKGIRWEVNADSSLVLNQAADETCFYYVFHDYNEYTEDNIPTDMDPLKKHLITHHNVKLTGENSNPLIIKIKFNL